MRVHRGAQDALNHAAALIGYFDGFEARGAFQERTSQLSTAKSVRTLNDLLDYIVWVLSEILSVVQDLHSRAPLQMCSGGPTKPGPMRTSAVCLQHLASLQHAACRLILQATQSEELRARIQGHLDS